MLLASKTNTHALELMESKLYKIKFYATIWVDNDNIQINNDNGCYASRCMYSKKWWED